MIAATAFNLLDCISVISHRSSCWLRCYRRLRCGGYILIAAKARCAPVVRLLHGRCMILCRLTKIIWSFRRQRHICRLTYTALQHWLVGNINAIQRTLIRKRRRSLPSQILRTSQRKRRIKCLALWAWSSTAC